MGMHPDLVIQRHRTGRRPLSQAAALHTLSHEWHCGWVCTSGCQDPCSSGVAQGMHWGDRRPATPGHGHACMAQQSCGGRAMHVGVRIPTDRRALPRQQASRMSFAPSGGSSDSGTSSTARTMRVPLVDRTWSCLDEPLAAPAVSTSSVCLRLHSFNEGGAVAARTGRPCVPRRHSARLVGSIRGPLFVPQCVTAGRTVDLARQTNQRSTYCLSNLTWSQAAADILCNLSNHVLLQSPPASALVSSKVCTAGLQHTPHKGPTAIMR